MKLSILASVFFASLALAGGGGDKTIPNGQPCKKDGSLGNCESTICDQEANKPQGTCAPKN